MSILLRKVYDAIFNSAAAAQAPVAATETIVAGSQITLNGPLAVGTKFKWRVVMTKTGAGTGNTSFLVKSNTGTAVASGTSGGAATMATLPFGVAETAVASVALVDIEVIVTAINATTGAVFAKLTAKNTATPTTGFGDQSVAVAPVNIATDATIASVGLAITSGAADVVTVNYAEGAQYAP